MLSLDPSNLLLLVLSIGALGLKIFALIDLIRRPTEAFPAAGKLTKPIWAVILVLAVVLGGTQVLGLFGIAGIIAAVVYLVDVRPAVAEMRPGGPWA